MMRLSTLFVTMKDDGWGLRSGFGRFFIPAANPKSQASLHKEAVPDFLSNGPLFLSAKKKGNEPRDESSLP